MAPLPQFLFRIAAALAAEHVTKRLVASPTFNRIIARTLHEVDHLPHRLNGRPVPPYVPPLGPHYDQPQEDIGEPHDLADPWNSSARSFDHSRNGGSSNGTSSSTSESQAHAQNPGGFQPRSRSKLRPEHSDPDGSPRNKHAGEQDPGGAEESQSDRLARELRELQDRLRGKS